MKSLDLKSSLVAAFAGGLLLLILVWAYDQIFSDPSDPLMPHAHMGLWFLLGAVVGLGTQTGERLTGVS